MPGTLLSARQISSFPKRSPASFCPGRLATLADPSMATGRRVELYQTALKGRSEVRTASCYAAGRDIRAVGTWKLRRGRIAGPSRTPVGVARNSFKDQLIVVRTVFAIE